uniref:Condensin-2 complex subunit D3 (inferred by orthology to a human protein) n=1 Tax=Strongyloides venezuelensis TaxID=75913 RepID=A0A0K0G3Q4_STRVS
MSLLDFLNQEFPFLYSLPQEVVYNTFDDVFSDINSFNLMYNFDFFDDFQSSIKLSKLGDVLVSNVGNSNNTVSDVKDELLLKKNLCILLWYGIEKALKDVKSKKNLVDGLHSVRCYFLLISMNGVIETDVYHVNIVAKCFNLYVKILRILRRNNSLFRNKSGKHKRSSLSLEDFSKEGIVLSEGEIKELAKKFNSSLDGLFIVIKKLKFTETNETLQSLCNVIKHLFRIDLSKETIVYEVESVKKFRKLKKFSDIGFALLHVLCNSDNPKFETLYTIIIMPRIMFTTIDGDEFFPSNCHINNEVTQICEIFLNFLKERVSVNNSTEHKVIYCMLVSACLQCPDKIEYRLKILKAVMDVINVMTLDHKKQFVEDILVIGENSRGRLRVLAIDAISLFSTTFKFINFNTQSTIDHDIFCSQGISLKREMNNQDIEIIYQESSTESLEFKLLRLLIYGIEDKLGSVRQRALAVLPSFLVDGNLSNQFNKGLVDLFKEFREIQLAKYRRKRRNNESVTGSEEFKKSRYPSESNNNNIDFDSFKPMGTSDVVFVSPEESVNDNTTQVSNDINSLRVDMNTTSINVQIISDKDGIFERKRTFKISDYPLLNRLLVRCDDNVAGCRKNAIIALQVLFPHLRKEEHVNSVINQFCRSARDKCISIRKQVSESICNILFYLNKDYTFYEKIIIASMECVLLQVVDREILVQLHAANLVYKMLFLPLINRDITHKIAWKILAYCESNLKYQKILKEVVLVLVRKKIIDDNLVYSLNKIMKYLKDDVSRKYIWMLYSILSVSLDVDPKNASEVFLTTGRDYVKNDFKLSNYLTTIIARGAKYLSSKTRKLLIQQIEKYITSFKIDINNISSFYYCYGVLLKGVDSEDETGKALFDQKNKEIFSIAFENMKLLMFEKYDKDIINLDSSIFEDSSNTTQKDGDDVKLARILSTIGEIIDYDNSFIHKDLFEKLQLIMSSKVCKKALRVHQEQTLNGTILSSNNFQNSILSSSRRISPLSIMKNFTSHHIRYTNITSIVQAQCVLLMGKICLVDEVFARDVIPVFMKELVTSKNYIIRNNIIVVTHDLCKHHTSLIGSYLDIFGACLNDDSVAVRIATLHCLTKLLKEGYLIWKGDIMFRFVSTLLDQVFRVREYAKFCLVETLLPVSLDMFYANFIDCLFYFNGVEHPSWIYYSQANGDNNLGKFNKHKSLKGTSYEKDRHKLYCFMLKNMTNIQKIAVTQKICIEIFEKIYNESLNFSDINVQNMLVDSFKLLSSEDGKVRFNMEKSGDEEDDVYEESGVRRRVITETAGKASKEMLKEVYVQEVMKYLLKLRYFLYASKNSRCAFEFLKYLLFLSNEHNHEFYKIINENKHLSTGVSKDIEQLKNKLSQSTIV